MMRELKGELKKLANLGGVDSVSKQLTVYEKRVRELVQDLKKDLDVRSRDVRAKGVERLDKFSEQVKKTRAEVEKQVRTVVDKEGKRLNEGLTELVAYLKSLSKEKAEAKAPAKKAKAKSAGEGKSAKPRAKRKTTAKARASAETSPQLS